MFLINAECESFQIDLSLASNTVLDHAMTEAIKKLQDDDGVAVTPYQFTQAWKLNDLKDPAKGLAVLLGGQWFWYQEGIDRIRGILTT